MDGGQRLQMSGSICMLLNLDLQDDTPPASLVVGTSRVCETSVDADACFSVNTGYLFA
jgi:hypothetical protein